MSNRDGRTAKRSKEPLRKKQLCPHCKKGKLEGADCCGRKNHKHHLICKTCWFTNF